MLMNMVASLDGKTTTDGKAGTIGSPMDRLIMRTLRARADAVMIGAGTVRAEKLRLDIPDDLAHARTSRGLKSQPLAVIAAGRGDIPLGENLIGSSPANLLILVPPETPQERRAALSTLGCVEVVPRGTESPGLDLNAALEILKKRYAVNTLVVEGGPAINHALVLCGLADELFLTLAPMFLGGEKPGALTMLEGRALAFQKTKPKLVSIHLSGDELFLRYALRPEAGTPSPSGVSYR